MGDLAGYFQGFMRRHAPSREEVLRSWWLRPFGRRIRKPGLWRFTRRSVPRGVAIGLFLGIFLMIPGLQIVGAALACAPVRGNIPIAAAKTILSNPATTPFFLVAAINVGTRFGFHADLAAYDALKRAHAPLSEWASWLLSAAAPAMVTGLAIIGAIVAFAGYWVALVGWRWWVAHKWRQRQAEL